VNPAVAKLFQDVDNPVFVHSAIQAVRSKQPIHTELLPDELLEPLYILECAARDMGSRVVDDFGSLRKRLEEVEPSTELARTLLVGAGFHATAPKYPVSAYMNCEPGEVRLEYLPLGIRFRSVNRVGTLIDKTPSRALVEWESGPQIRKFTDHRTGEDVTITSNGRQRTGCALDATVVPLYTSVSPEDRTWATNAWKELSGVFNDNSVAVPTKGRRKK